MSTLYSTSINLGSSATFDVGTQANNIVQLDANAKLPAVDGSLLTNLPAGNITGALVYRGVYDATANNPPLTNAVKGDFYKVSVQGTLAGVALNVNDHIVFNQNASAPITSAMFDVVDNTESTDTLDTVTTNGATTTNNIATGQVTVSGDVLPANDAQHTIGAEATRFITAYSDLNGAIRFKAKNDQGASISKGQAVYIKGISGGVPTVALAQANSSNTMQAFGFVAENANDQAECQVITFGNINAVDTSAFSAGDTLYISSTVAGGVVNTAPAGESNLIQNIGKVLRSHATEGIIKVGGAGRTNATPNLDQNKIFLGNASNQAVSTALSAVNLSSFNNDLGLATVATSGSYNDLSNTPSLVTNLNGLSDVTLTNPSANQALTYDNLNSVFINADIDYNNVTNKPVLATVATSGSYNDLSNTPTLGTASALDVGTNANQVVQLDANAKLPAVDGSLLTNLPSGATKPSVEVDTNPANPYNITTYTNLEEVYILTPSSNITVTIPSAGTVGEGYKYQIKNMSTNTITIDPSGTETIDGAGNTTFDLAVQYQSVTLVSDGINQWFII